MSGGIEAAGDVTTGGLIGRAIEPHAGERATADAQDSATCLNCGAVLTGPFCHACGQPRHIHKTLGSIVHDLAHGILHVEGKIWHTLPLLAWRPGELTRRYIDGQRARFVSPMAVFLFSVFLMFAVVANLPGWDFGKGNFLDDGPSVSTARGVLEQERAKASADVHALEARLAKVKAQPAASAGVPQVQEKLERARTAERGLAKAVNALPTAPPDLGSTSNDWFNAKYRAAKANPELLLFKIKSVAYKFSWALIPISLPFVWLLFPLRRDVGLYDHAVFATYSLAFMSLLVIVLAVLGAAGVPNDLISLAATVIPPVHIYRQLKGAYGLSRLSALWRTAWMLVFALTAFVVFVILLVAIGAME